MIVLFLIISAGCSYIILSGNHYLFFTLRHTVFKGRLGPSIDEYQIYANRVVEASDKPEPWPAKDIGASFTSEEMKMHDEFGTAAFLVVKRDTIVYEYYNEGYSDSSYTNSWSMAKSIIGLLVGIAIDDGLIPSTQAKLSDYFEQYNGSGITIEHLLNMSSGINFDENYLNPFAHSAKSLYCKDIVALNDDYQAVQTPGEIFDYQGGNTILLGMILRKITGMTVSEYASVKLWKKIGAEHPAYWSLDKEGGLERVFCCLNSNARDFARIGKLIEHDGIWNGDTIVSPEYVRRSTSPAQLKLSVGGKENNKYGFQWWVLRLKDHYGSYARGLQGQYIVSLPKEDLIVVRLGHKRPGKEHLGHSTDMLKYVAMARRMTN